MSVFDTLTDELNWRESELGALKVLLKSTRTTKIQREVLLRASWAMLYAHYEGFSKFSLALFYDEASKRLSDCALLPPRTKAFALDKHIKKIRNLSPIEILDEIANFQNFEQSTKPSFPEVDTKSNLWPNVMEDLLLDANIVVEVVGTHTSKLKTLVNRRNDIAHGKQNLIDEVDYYLTYENAVYDIMYHLSYAIEKRLNEAPYI